MSLFNFVGMHNLGTDPGGWPDEKGQTPRFAPTDLPVMPAPFTAGMAWLKCA